MNTGGYLVATVDTSVRAAVDSLKAGLREIYGDRLHQVILFGSQARGEATASSDIDVMIVLEGEVRPFEELDKIGDLVWSVDMEHDVLLAVVPVSLDDYETRQSPLLMNVRREGVPA